MVLKVLNSPVRLNKKSMKVLLLLVLILPFTFLIFYWCHLTNSLALTSYAYITLFNFGSLLTGLISTWASKQQPTPKFSYGFERVNVLSVFSTTILLILFGINLIKHSAERVLNPPVVSTDHMLLGVCVGLAVHLMITCIVPNKPLVHASEAATPNWMQRALNDLAHSLCGHSPSFRRLFHHSKINPFNLLIVGGALTVVLTQLLIDLDELYLADVAGSLFISFLICATMLPLSIYSAKILLQTAPEHILPLLDKSLREVSTLNGVLELKNEHFWTIAFGSYAGSIHVRVRRDANEQEVLTQLTSRLASQLNDLTIQIVKDDWALPRITQLSNSPALSGYNSRLVPSPPPPLPASSPSSSMFPTRTSLPHHSPLTPSHSVGGVGHSSVTTKAHPHVHMHSSPRPHPHHHHDNVLATSSVVSPSPYITPTHPPETL